MERRPRAPVFCVMAFFAMAWTASSVKTRPTPSYSSSWTYCFIMAFLGSYRTWTRSSSVRFSSETMTGSLPINSGMRPYFTISWVSTLERAMCSSVPVVFCCMSAAKPMELFFILPCMIFSIPAKAPPHIKRMSVVSTWM